jgi:SAM-dependent methyltransferase
MEVQASMSPEIKAVFESICATADLNGQVLEVGAVPGHDGLLSLPCLSHLDARFGINQLSFTDNSTGISWITGNANHMDCFPDDHFSAVLCNSTLEHDSCFWLTIREIHRVTASGGLIVIGVPSYVGMGPKRFINGSSWFDFILLMLARLFRAHVLESGTPTLGEHFFPKDYYRFSEQAVREVFLAGLRDIQTLTVMVPPRIIGWGWKP